jgi:bile acid-coenzyme A ligase
MTETPPIGSAFSALAAQSPDAPAVTCEGRTLTRAQLDRETNRLARAYAELGVGHGDYVVTVLPNSIEFVAAVLATWKLGAIPQPLSARLPDAELSALLQLRPPRLVVGRDDPTGVSSSVPADFTPDRGLSDAALPEAVSPVFKAMASGGSTGRPKLIDAGSDSRLTPLVGYGMGAADGDVNLLSVPLTHNTGFTTMAIGLVLGHHLVVMPRFDAHEFLRLVTEYGVQFLTTVPTIMQRLLPVYRAASEADPDAYDLSTIRRFWHLASPCPPAIKQAWIDLLGPEVVWNSTAAPNYRR